jgi:hypothetical protein
MTYPNDAFERGADDMAARALVSNAVPTRALRSMPLVLPPGPLFSSLGEGVPMHAGMRADLEPRFGFDLSALRLHADAAAVRSAQDHGAIAYAIGSHIVLDPRHLRPDSEGGRRLLAHEIAHTLQPAVRSGRVLARQSTPVTTETEIGAPTAEDGFGELWQEFERLRAAAEFEAALALVPDLLREMSAADAVEHAAELAIWLIAHGQRELAGNALVELEKGWWVFYAMRPLGSLPENLAAGHATPAGPADLFAQAETEARAGRHEFARKLLQSAFLMTEMMLRQTIGEYQALVAELDGEIGEAEGGAALETQFDQLTTLRGQIIGLYPHLASESHRAGDEATTEVLVEQGQLFMQAVMQELALDEAPVLGSAQAAPTESATASDAQGAAHVPTQSEAETEATGGEAPDATEPISPLDEPDQLIEGPPPFQGSTVIQFHGNVYVNVDSPRYAVTTSVTRASDWSRNLFGVRSSVVVAHVDEDGQMRFYVAALDEDITSRMPRAEPGGTTLVDVTTRIVQLSGDWVIIVIHVGNGMGFWPSPESAESYHRMVGGEAASGQAGLDPQLVRETLFQPIDELIQGSAEEQEQAAERLAELDAAAFSTADAESRARYLLHLLAVGPSEAQERAIIEILKSIASQVEFEALLSRVRADAAAWDAMFDDMDHALWSLITTVGERFGDPAPLTLEDLLHFMSEAGLLNIATPLPGLSIGPKGPEISVDALAEIEQAGLAFIRFVENMWDGILMMVTRPDQIMEGLAQLVRMSVVFQLANLGYQPAIQARNQIIAQIGLQLLNGFKGLAVLGIQERFTTRVKWSIIWEIASFFAGTGVAAAALIALGLTARTAAVARFVRLLGLAGEAAKAEQVGTILSRLAGILSRSSRILTVEDDVLIFLARLPEEDATRLAKALEGVDLEDGLDLARLAAKHPELANVAQESLRHAEILSQFAAKAAGGFTDEIGSAFARLRAARFTPAELEDIIAQIPSGQGERFAQMLTRIPQEVSLAGGARLDILRVIAANPVRMDAVTRLGIDAVQAAFRQSGGSTALLDDYIEAFAAIEGQMPAATRAQDMQDLLQRFQQDEAAALFQVHEQIRSGPGAARLATQLDPVVTQWAAPFQRRPLVVTDQGRAYQYVICGNTETHVMGGGVEVWADEILPAQGMLRDAKYTNDLRRSPFIDMPNHPMGRIRNIVLQNVYDELARYSAVINDPATPVFGLEIVSNTPLSVPFWERMLQQFNIPGRVVVNPIILE